MLTQLTTLKARLEITVTTYDAILTNAIKAVSARFDKECNRILAWDTAKAVLAGGVDLIGKPFITFEITVKALTMVLRRRLDLAEVRIPDRNIPVAEAQSRTVEEP